MVNLVLHSCKGSRDLLRKHEERPAMTVRIRGEGGVRKEFTDDKTKDSGMTIRIPSLDSQYTIYHGIHEKSRIKSTTLWDFIIHVLPETVKD